MRLVWCSWKDMDHPLAGGAEVVTHNLLTRLVANGHEVVLLTSQSKGQPSEVTSDGGYPIKRMGNRFTVYGKVKHYIQQHQLDDWADIIIDETNTIPFFVSKYSKAPVLMFFHQLAREVWFYQMPWPLSRVGYIIEPWYLRRINDTSTITISESTKQDLVKVAGFRPENISIITQGNSVPPLKSLQGIEKYPTPTLLSLGAIRPMKRTGDIVRAFNVAKAKVPELQLIIAGDDKDPYADTVKKLIEHSPYRQDISVLGRVSSEKRAELMQRSWLSAVTSVKEGWGLIVTEANGQGTPVAGYDVDGLRDSIQDHVTGLIAQPNPTALGNAIAELCSYDHVTYQAMRTAAWENSKQYTFDQCYDDFLGVVTNYVKRVS
jgi:glycosyltransferase involved in cell wall biosynthesis